MPKRPQPEQIHLAYGGAPSKMSVTLADVRRHGNFVRDVGPSERALTQKVRASVSRFVDGGTNHSVRYIHRAMITGIVPGRRHYYRVGSHRGRAAAFIFAVYGDLGDINARSLGKLQEMTQAGAFDMVIHNGDLAYNLDIDQGQRGDDFMRQIQPVAAHLPYMVSVGNHEQAYNFSHFKNRFTMPSSTSIWAPLTSSPSPSEFYFFTNYGRAQIQNQWAWLINDLKVQSERKPEASAVGSSSTLIVRCTARTSQNASAVRRTSFFATVSGTSGRYGLEKVLYNYGVDLYIGAHQHNYEVFYPIYNFHGKTAPFTDPPLPVHVTTGSAGCQEKTYAFPKTPSRISAFRSSNYGFTKMQVFNSTHIRIQQLLATGTKVENQFWLIKHSHPHRL
ncbi:Purple acid phosphatase [Aphelenchoides fujianensis]|nr:Purple acid phosphatase [Aphelenchoides fujianensis]